MKEKTFKIVRGDIGHASVIVDLIIKLLESRETSEDKPERSKFLAVVDSLLPQTNYYAVFIAYHKDETPVGIITVYRSCSFYRGGVFGTIAEVYVKPEFRSLGIGKSLLDEAIYFAKQNKWCKLELGSQNIEISNRTMELYKNLGFEQKGSVIFLSLPENSLCLAVSS